MRPHKIKTLLLSIPLLATIFCPLIARADTAQTLPKGVFYFNTKYYYYFPIYQRYDPDGDPEDLATDFNKELDSQVFPALAALGPYVGGNATVGSSEVDFKYLVQALEFKFYYGLTDKVSIGFLVPYEFLKNEVRAKLNTSSANVGKNATMNSLAPLAVPGTVPLTTNDIQNLLGKGLDINGDGTVDVPGYGYKRVETWRDSGIDDIELTAKYQFYNARDWRIAFEGGVRVPTGEVDDPDSLVDLGFGTGQTDLLFRLYTDYIGIKNLTLNATVRYDLQLSDKELLRVPDNVNNPVTANKEYVRRNLGDVLELEAMGNYSFTPEISGGLKYRFSKKSKDSVSGSQGFAYSSLEDETDYSSQMFFVFLGYSSVNKYLEKKASVPFSIDLEYRNRFAGTNNVNKSQYLQFSFTLFLK